MSHSLFADFCVHNFYLLGFTREFWSW